MFFGVKIDFFCCCSVFKLFIVNLVCTVCNSFSKMLLFDKRHQLHV